MLKPNDHSQVVLGKKQPTGSQLRSTKAVNQAQRKGLEISTTKKQNAASNKQHTQPQNALKLDSTDDIVKVKTVDMSVGKIIMQARQERGLTQKDLATRISEKPQVVVDYEAGKAVTNNQILTKLERALNTKLRGKDKGKPLVVDKKSTSSK